MQNMLISKLNFKAVEGHDKYLRLPTYVGRSKKIVFQVIQDRVWKKVSGWKERCLSRAGREVLLKSIAQAIPTYAMQCFKIPEGVISAMNSICRNFWWGQKGDENKLALLSWKRLCTAKEAGGVGLRDLSALQHGPAGQTMLEISDKPTLIGCLSPQREVLPSNKLLGSQGSTQCKLYMEIDPLC